MLFMVIAFLGRMGSGKTLNMSKWGSFFAEQCHKELIANYHLKNASYFNTHKQIKDIKNAIICYDEITTDHDSRNWENNVKFTHWFLQLRKIGCDFLYSTQRWNTVEKRIRENTDIIIRCSKKRQIGSNQFIDKWAFVEKIFDIQDGEDQAITGKTLINKYPQFLYGLYDTNEIINNHYND